MKTVMRNWFPLSVGYLLTIVFSMVVALPAHGGEPLGLVNWAADRAIQILKDPTLKAPEKKKERIERLKEVVNPIFDYEGMAKRSLGPHWRRDTPAEQDEFAKLFGNFLEKIYADRIDLYEGQRVVFGKETIENNYAEVESVMINGKSEETSVVYRLKRTGGTWKVYDAGGATSASSTTIDLNSIE